MAGISSRFFLGALALVVAASGVAQEATPVPAPRRGGRALPSQQPIQLPTDGDGARKVADRAIAELVGWKTTAARNILDGGREKYGDTLEYKTAAALLKVNEGKLQDALDRLKAVSTAAPADPTPEYFKGEVLQVQKQYDAADAAWTKARDRAKAIATAQPKNARAQFYLGAALVKLDQPGPARTALAAAAEEGFDKRMIGFQTGLSRVTEKQWSPAVDAFTAVIALDERFAPAFFYRGLVWSKLDRKDLMLNDLERFLALAPSSPDASTARALMAALAG